MIPAPSEPSKIPMYSPTYYAACTAGGIFSCGHTHMTATPLDLVKCNMQISTPTEKAKKTMSLVDYASSDEDEEEIKVQVTQTMQVENNKLNVPKDDPVAQPIPSTKRSTPSSNQEREHSSEPSVVKLPDAALLLNSPTLTNMSSYDHSSRVAAAMAENASRKRESNATASTYPPRSKVPRGSLPHSRNIPDIPGGLLRPPQLSGRSNVVTEDISKLFVKRPTTDPSAN